MIGDYYNQWEAKKRFKLKRLYKYILRRDRLMKILKLI
jgi:hypothetical protein